MIELMIVVSIIAVLVALLATGLLILREDARRRDAQNEVQRLHMGLTTLVMEKSVPVDPIDGNDGSGHLVYGDLVVGGATVPSVLKRMHELELFSFSGSGRIDAADRLLDVWQQPYLFVVGDDADPNGHVPASLAGGTYDDWQVVNPRGDAEMQIYVYSYGPDNRSGQNQEADQWVYNRKE